MRLGYLHTTWKQDDNTVENIKLSKSKKVTNHSKFKAMLIVSFDIQGVAMAECVPRSQTVSQY
jgi:hypothetical protein